MAEPSRDDVNLFTSLTNLSPAEAITWLKAHNNNVNNAANAFWDNPESLLAQPFVEKWDENPFHSDKMDMGQQGQSRSCENPWEAMEAFTILSQDTLKPNVFAPSRPPSRVSIREAHPSTELAVGPSRPLNLEEQENEEMEQALALSMSNPVPGQESGVTDGHFPYFGPAKRDDYDSNWTMTATGPRTKEIMLNPEPIDRKRERNVPAFLKPTPQAYRLAALLKILQTISISREALLCRDKLLPDYGWDAEWWDGTAIRLPKVSDLSQPSYFNDREEIIHETQRLVAFLEETDRAYGSIDVMANMDGLRGKEDASILPAFLDQWREIVDYFAPNFQLRDVCRSVLKKENFENSAEDEDYRFSVLDLRVDETIADKGQTLYEVIDDTLWPDPKQNVFDKVYFEKTADVFIMDVARVSETGSGLGIKIPPVWYSDRYLRSSNQQVQEMQAVKAAIRKEIGQIEEAKAKVTEVTLSTIQNPVLDAIQLLKAATAYFEASASTSGVINGENGASGISHGLPDRHGHGKIADELKALTERITQKLRTFEILKGKALEKLNEFSKLYTKPSDNPEVHPRHKYMLRGVCSLASTMYVLERTQPDDENDILSSEPTDWQWWKISFIGTDSKPVSRTKVREIEVLKATKDDSRNATLVYASERAILYQVEDLPSQLRNFVRRDNTSFTAEVEKLTADFKPATPTKRKADDIDGEQISSKFYRSSPQRNENDFQQSSNHVDPAVDPALPPYTATATWSPPFSPSRSNSATWSHNLRNPDTYDDRNSAAHPHTGAPLDISAMMLDQDQDDRGRETGQEMLDRGGRLSLHTGNEQLNQGFSSSAFMEITMEDKEDENVQTSKHVEFAGEELK